MSTTNIDDVELVHVHLTMTYDEWQAVLDALEVGANHAQVEVAQDTLHRRAPRPWIDAAERRDEATDIR